MPRSFLFCLCFHSFSRLGCAKNPEQLHSGCLCLYSWEGPKGCWKAWKFLLNIYSPGTTDLEMNWWVRSAQARGISSAHLLFLSCLPSVLWADHSLWWGDRLLPNSIQQLGPCSREWVLSGKETSLLPLCSTAVSWLQSSRLGPQNHRTSAAPGCHHLLQQGQPDFSPFLNFCKIKQPSWLILFQFYCSKLDFKGNWKRFFVFNRPLAARQTPPAGFLSQEQKELPQVTNKWESSPA